MTRAIALVDGEHYPPVVVSALESLTGDGYEIVAAVFCGGGEKLREPLSLGDVPIVTGSDAGAAMRSAILTYEPEIALDLSDDPVVTHELRMSLAAVAVAYGVTYVAPGLRLDPPPRPRIATVPAIEIIGSGKRCGKTAVAGHVARTLRDAGMRPAMVAMGRGGPAQPVLVRGDETPPSAKELLELSLAGEHAASDVYEDAVLAGVPAAGARRAGAGPSGAVAFDTVAAAISLAETVNPDVLLLEGSGTAVPPCAADGTILVVRDTDDPSSWPLAHRLLLADLVLVRMPGEEVTSTRISTLASPSHPVPPVVHMAFRPTPLGSVVGRRTLVATTAPEAAGGMWREVFEQTHGALLAGITHHLGDRRKLEADLAAAAGTYDVLACELKAAAVDVAVARAMEADAEVVFVDNRPVGIDADLEQQIMKATAIAQERFRAAR